MADLIVQKVAARLEGKRIYRGWWYQIHPDRAEYGELGCGRFGTVWRKKREGDSLDLETKCRIEINNAIQAGEKVLAYRQQKQARKRNPKRRN